MLLINERTGEIVASTVEVARTRTERRRGLLGRASLAPDAALVLTPCNAVHTFGMRFAIDVLFVNSRGRIRKITRGLPPRRIAIAPSASTTIELAAGWLQSVGVAVGDRVYLCSASAAAGGRGSEEFAAGLRTGNRRMTAASPAWSGS